MCFGRKKRELKKRIMEQEEQKRLKNEAKEKELLKFNQEIHRKVEMDSKIKKFEDILYKLEKEKNKAIRRAAKEKEGSVGFNRQLSLLRKAVENINRYERLLATIEHLYNVNEVNEIMGDFLQELTQLNDLLSTSFNSGNNEENLKNFLAMMKQQQFQSEAINRQFDVLMKSTGSSDDSLGDNEDLIAEYITPYKEAQEEIRNEIKRKRDNVESS